MKEQRLDGNWQCSTEGGRSQYLLRFDTEQADHVFLRLMGLSEGVLVYVNGMLKGVPEDGDRQTVEISDVIEPTGNELLIQTENCPLDGAFEEISLFYAPKYYIEDVIFHPEWKDGRGQYRAEIRTCGYGECLVTLNREGELIDRYVVDSWQAAPVRAIKLPSFDSAARYTLRVALYRGESEADVWEQKVTWPSNSEQ